MWAGANAAGSYCIVLDIFPASAASFTGVDNTIAQSTGIIAPLVTGVLLVSLSRTVFPSSLELLLGRTQPEPAAIVVRAGRWSLPVRLV